MPLRSKGGSHGHHLKAYSFWFMRFLFLFRHGLSGKKCTRHHTCSKVLFQDVPKLFNMESSTSFSFKMIFSEEFKYDAKKVSKCVMSWFLNSTHT